MSTDLQDEDDAEFINGVDKCGVSKSTNKMCNSSNDLQSVNSFRE